MGTRMSAVMGESFLVMISVMKTRTMPKARVVSTGQLYRPLAARPACECSSMQIEAPVPRRTTMRTPTPSDPLPLTARLADITTLRVDAIVNAANEWLAPGGGVCGAIHAAAGPELERACAAVAPCPEGEARITPGFALPARYVIHAVGPRWHGGTHGEADRLAAAYRASFALARAHGIRSIAFPAISTGIFGYPLQPATEIAVREARSALARGDVEAVVFSCFSQDVLDAYRRLGVNS